MTRWMIIVAKATEDLCESAKIVFVPAEKGKTMEPYKIVMLAIVLALEIPAAIILVAGWIKACKEARRAEDGK